MARLQELLLLFSVVFMCLLPIELALGLQDSQRISIVGVGEIFYGSISSLQVFRAHSTDNLTAEQKKDINLLAQNLDMYLCWYSRGFQVPKLHAVNPNMIILLYRNIRAIYDDSDEWQMALDNGWFLKDSSGAFVTYEHGGDVDYMADIGNPDYQDFVANWIQDCTELYGFDGVFSDNGLFVKPSRCFWGCSSEPVNPRTGNLWTNEEIVDAYIAFHNRIKAAIGSKLDIPNGIFNGERFFSEISDEYVKILTEANVDGFMSEGLFAYMEYYSENKWKESLDFVVWVQNNFLNQTGKIYCPHGPCVDDKIPDDCTTQQMATFVFSSLLLGINRSQNYLSLYGAMLLDETQNLFKIDLGVPKGDYYVIEETRIYARDFTKIKVLVNPTDQPFSVYFDIDYETLEGQIVSSVNMEPHTGLILKVVGA